MKKNGLIPSVAIMALICLFATGCKKEGSTVNLRAHIDYPGKDAKVYIDNLTPCWNDGDQIFVNNASYPVSGASGSAASLAGVAENEDGYYAIYPASIVGSSTITGSAATSVTLPRFQTYTVEDGHQKVEVPMGAYSSGNTLTFHNLCSILKVVVVNHYQDFTMSGIEVFSTTTPLSGEGSVTITGNDNDVITMGTDVNASPKAVTLRFNGTDGALAYGESGTYYIVVPSFEQVSNNVTFTLIDEQNRKIAQFEFNNRTLDYNSITTVTLDVTTMMSLSDLFSVSANSKVRFSKGNLQWTATGTHTVYNGNAESTVNGTFRFAEHQYDYIGSANSSISSSYTGYIDLFGYGTSGYSSVDPYSTTTTVGSYASGNINDTYYDWGKYNSIVNGSVTDAYGTWRTLTQSEWSYVISTRAASTINGTMNVRFAKAQVNGVNGLILFPDLFVWPTSVTHYPLFGEGAATFASAQYSLEEWQALEDMNAIFLPAAGHRSEGTTVSSAFDFGVYWTSTNFSDNDAYVMQFRSNEDGSDVRVDASDGRGRKNMGLAVRLVKDYIGSESK